MLRRGLRASIVLVSGVTAVAAWGGVRAWEAQRLRAGLDQARREMALGRYQDAWRRLASLPTGGEGEVEYQLGLCELYRGRRAAAMAAWDRVPPATPFAARAAVQRGMLTMDSGRFAQRRGAVRDALRRLPDPEKKGPLLALQLLYRYQGRTSDARRAIVESWAHTASPSDVLVQLYRLDTSPSPVERMRDVLEKADASDDRVWLGWANLAIQSGQFDIAGRWLDACLRRRPDDTTSWRARLDLAMATGDVDRTWQALGHLPTGEFWPAEVLRIRAWLAGRQGDGRAERTVLAALIAEEPGDTVALGRLAELALEAGEMAEVAALRASQAEMTAAKGRYRLLLRGDALGDPAELARLADALGRRTEARGWALIRDGRAPGRPGRPSPSSPGARRRTRDGRSPRPAPTSAGEGACGDSPRAPPPVVLQFVDDAESAGLRFVHDNGQTPMKRLPETMSGGVGLLDYDGDGWLDVYAVQGGPFPPPANPAEGDRLFRNRGDGTFEDVTDRAGLHRVAAGATATASPSATTTTTAIPTCSSRDGGPTPCCTTGATGRSRTSPTTPGSAAIATGPPRRPGPTSTATATSTCTSAITWSFDVKNPRVCADAGSRVNHYCSPRDFAALPDHVFRNDGGRFVDVTPRAGLRRPGRARAGRRRGRPGRRQPHRPLRRQRHVGELPVPQPGRFPLRGDGLRRRRGRQLRAAASSRAWASLAATSTATVAPTWPSPTTTASRPRSSATWAAACSRDDTAAMGLAAPTRQPAGLRHRLPRRQQRRPARPDLGQRPRQRLPTGLPLEDAHPIARGRAGRPADGRLRPRRRPPFQPLHLGRGLAAGDLDNDGRIEPWSSSPERAARSSSTTGRPRRPLG